MGRVRKDEKEGLQRGASIFAQMMHLYVYSPECGGYFTGIPISNISNCTLTLNVVVQ